MQLAAEFGTGQVFWSILWFFLFFVWIMLIFTIFGDIIRSDDMGGVAKAIWSIFVIFLPFLGIFAYLIVRGGSMGERQMKAAKAQQAAMDDYIRTTASGAAARPTSSRSSPTCTARASSTTPSTQPRRPKSSAEHEHLATLHSSTASHRVDRPGATPLSRSRWCRVRVHTPTATGSSAGSISSPRCWATASPNRSVCATAASGTINA